MSLFDIMERADVGPRLYAEPEYVYLNRSGRPGVQKIRDLTGPLPPLGRALAEPPGSRAWSFHACGGL